jgi:WD40 repeat protein
MTSDLSQFREDDRREIGHSAALVDVEHPWLGLESFSEQTRAYFFGRGAEIEELCLRSRSHPLLVVYGRSGLGKTSVLTAGLIPRLRQDRQRPALLRLRLDDARPDLARQVVAAISESDESGWVEGLAREVRVSLPTDPLSHLWLRLHYRRLPPAVTHLVFDQFEEIFTLGAQIPGAEETMRDVLTVLLHGAIPPSISRVIADHDTFESAFDPDSVPVRALLVMRDDYVYALNRWRRHLPALGQNTFELKGLRGPEAYQAVVRPGELRCHFRNQPTDAFRVETGLPPIVDERTAAQIVRFVAHKGPDVALDDIEAVPPILSLLCRELNARRFISSREGADTAALQITYSDEPDAQIETIIAAFYERCLAPYPEAVRVFIEEDFVSQSGARLAQDEVSIVGAFEHGYQTSDGNVTGFGNAAAARACLVDLVNQRLLSALADKRYELIHDLLAQVVVQSRAARRAKSDTLRAERAAREAREAELAHEREARRHSEDQQQLAEARTRLADEQRRLADEHLAAARRTTRIVSLLLTAATLFALVAAYEWWRIGSLSQQAQDARDRAESQLADSAFREASFRGDKPREGLAFAARALRLRPDASTRALTASLLVATPRMFRLVQHAGRVSAVAWSPDGRWIATASSDHTARVWDARTGEPVGAPLKHGDEVNEVEWSPDGTRIATASDDHTARVWDARTGQPASAPLQHGDKVETVAWSPDGMRLATGSDDHTARIWDLRKGQPAVVPLQHGDTVEAVAWNPSGTLLATGSMDHSARIWNAQTGGAVGTPLQHANAVVSVAWSPNGALVATAAWDGMARIWDARTRRPVGEPLQHAREVTAVAWSPDGTHLATASLDRTALLWNVKTGKLERAPLWHVGGVVAVAWSRDGARLATASLDQTARVWDVSTGMPIGGPLQHTGSLSAVAWSPDGTQLATASFDQTARVWDVRAREALGAPLQHAMPVGAVAWSPDGTRIATASWDKTAQVWDARTGQTLGPPLQHASEMTGVAWSPDGTRVAAASRDGMTRVWDAKTGQPIGAPLQHEGDVTRVAWSPDGTRIATASLDRSARIWDAKTGKAIGELLQHSREVIAVAWSPDGSRVATASLDGTARVWDGKTGHAVVAPLEHGPNVVDVAWSPDGTRIATASYDQTRIWDARSGRAMGMPLSEGGVRSVAWSPDGTRIATASSDQTARVWDTRTSQAVGTPLFHDGEVTAVAWSPDGTRLATASYDSTARIWDARTGLPVSTALVHGGAVLAVAWSPDGSRLATASNDTTARIWDASGFDAMDAPALARLAEELSGLRVNELDAIVPSAGLQTPTSGLAALLKTLDEPGRKNSPFSKFAHWLLADPFDRSVSPAVTMSPDEYVRRMISLGPVATAEAESAFSGHPLLHEPARARSVETSAPKTR